MSFHEVEEKASVGRTGTTLPSEADWERIRPTFEQLYIDQHATLTAVMAELRQNHNFKATKQMYKRRIREWGLGKNLKQHEVEHILGILSQREAQGKNTLFMLRGRRVDMCSVRTYQRRQKLRTSDAVATYVTGRSKECRELRALTPEHWDPSSWVTPDQSYEKALRAFAALLSGLVDSRYYWIELSEIVMPPSVLRGEVSDVCSSLVASKPDGVLNMTAVRKLALLLESIVRSNDAWIHCRLVYSLWTISTSGHPVVSQSLLAHLHRLATACLDPSCAQYRFVTHYSSLETSRATKLAADIILLKAQTVRGFRIETDPDVFKLRSLDYDVFWRQREQGNGGGPDQALDIFERCGRLLGPLAVETLTVLRAILQDRMNQQAESFDTSLNHLRDSSKLSFYDDPPTFTFDGLVLGLEAASELACIYCELGSHDAEAWIFDRLLVHQKQTASCLRREYSLLVHISRCAALSQDDRGLAWLERKNKIDGTWLVEVEAAVSTNSVNEEP